MKKILLVLSIVMIALFFWACSNDAPEFRTTQLNLDFSNNPEGADVLEFTFDLKVRNVNQAVDYEITTTADWLTIDPMSGSVGTVPETITVTVNDPFPEEDKTDTITISETSSFGLSDLVIDTTFTYTFEKDDVFLTLVGYSNSDGDTVYGYVDQDENLTTFENPSTTNAFYKVADLEWLYDWNSETGDIYGAGYSYDENDKEVVTVWKNGTVQPQIPAPPNTIENSGSLSSIVSRNRMAVMNDEVHLIVHALQPGYHVDNYPDGYQYGNNWDHYYNGTDYEILPDPSSGNTYSIEGIKQFNNVVYIYGTERDITFGTDTLSSGRACVRPLVWINDGTNITLVESFPSLADVMGGELTGDEYWAITPKDIYVNDAGDIFVCGYTYRGDTGYGPWTWYTGLFKDDGTYIPKGPNNGQNSGDPQLILNRVATENNYSIEMPGYMQDLLYLDDQEATLEVPSLFDVNKGVKIDAMDYDGEDTYSAGDHEHYKDGTGDDPALNHKTVVYRGTNIVLEINSYNDGEFEFFDVEDLEVPVRPAQ